MPMSKAESTTCQNWKKRDVVWEWLETIDRSISQSEWNVQLLHERIRKLEDAGRAGLTNRPYFSQAWA